jgi:hypothetical protein
MTGQAIEYEEVSNKGKTSAEILRVQRRGLPTGRHPTTAASTGLLVFAFCHIPARQAHER